MAFIINPKRNTKHSRKPRAGASNILFESAALTGHENYSISEICQKKKKKKKYKTRLAAHSAVSKQNPLRRDPRTYYLGQLTTLLASVPKLVAPLLLSLDQQNPSISSLDLNKEIRLLAVLVYLIFCLVVYPCTFAQGSTQHDTQIPSPKITTSFDAPF